MPCLALRFDTAKVEEVESLWYGRHCFRVLFRAVDLQRLAGTKFSEGDTAATLTSNEYVYAIALQNPDQAVLDYVKQALEQSTEFNEFAATPRFLEGAAIDGEPLVAGGEIDPNGKLKVPADRFYNADYAVDDIKKEQNEAKIEDPAGAEQPPQAESQHESPVASDQPDTPEDPGEQHLAIACRWNEFQSENGPPISAALVIALSQGVIFEETWKVIEDGNITYRCLHQDAEPRTRCAYMTRIGEECPLFSRMADETD